MANHVIRDVVSEIRVRFFSIICDEYTDISNKEQLTICIRWVDIGAETTVPAIKDVLSKLQLSLVNCWGKCYDGASNITCHKHGVVKRISTKGLSYSLSWTLTQLKGKGHNEKL